MIWKRRLNRGSQVGRRKLRRVHVTEITSESSKHNSVIIRGHLGDNKDILGGSNDKESA